MIDELISACFSEFCEIAGDSPCGCDACPYGRTNDDCYAIYEHDKLTTLEKKGITPLKWIPVSSTPAVPGPSEDDPNIMELCFHNGENHMRDKIKASLLKLSGDMTCVTISQVIKILEDL